ncbi:MAG: UvrD-helicase domain-containing protein, partial [Dehalococcoidia bacterium]|nr:UvrD-helicase domain-containing protein [Dehalococcoidia bacterium]
ELNAGTIHGTCYKMIRGERTLDIGPKDSPHIVKYAEPLTTGETKRIIQDILGYRGPFVTPSNRNGWAVGWKPPVDWIKRAKLATILPNDSGAWFQRRMKELTDDNKMAVEYGWKLSICYQEYERAKTQLGKLDFNDMILWVALGLRHNDAFRARWQGRVDYVLVDEVQDTNALSMEVLETLAAPDMRLFAVGDDSQCIHADEPVAVPGGFKRIGDVVEGDTVLAAIGRGRVAPCRVVVAKKQTVTTKLLTMVTSNWNSVRCTPNHIIFASTHGLNSHTRRDGQPSHYVYLMFKDGMGYRIGYSTIPLTRANGEGADATWLLRSFRTMEEALFHETLWSTKFGIPQETFRWVGGLSKLTDVYLQRLFSGLDTAKGAAELLAHLGVDAAYPHDVPQNAYHGRTHERATAYLQMCYDTRRQGTGAHILSLETSRPDLVLKYGQRMRAQREDYSDLKALADDLRSSGVRVEIRANFLYLPHKGHFAIYKAMSASNILPGMKVLVYDKDRQQVVEDVIEIVEWEDAQETTVVDLQIDKVANYIVGGVVVHNSLYRFNAATPFENIYNFQQRHPTGLVLKLETNYRSTRRIVALTNAAIAQQFIDKPELAQYRKTITPKPDALDGSAPDVRSFVGTAEEGKEVAKSIKQAVELGHMPRDFAIIARTNAQLRSTEDAMMQTGIPYLVEGGIGFYDRVQVRECLGLVYLAINPADDEAFKQSANIATADFWKPTHGFGRQIVDEVSQLAASNNISVFDAACQFRSNFNRWQSSGVDDLESLLSAIRRASV